MAVPEPALWMLWMTSHGQTLQNQEGGLLQVAGEDEPVHPLEAAAAMTSTTQMTRGTSHTLEGPTMMTSGAGTALPLTLDPAIGPGTPETMAPGPGIPNMMGGS